jgi:hypothetical protein
MAGKKKQAKNQAVSAQGTLGNVTDYRHDEATRKNNPPAKIAAEGTIPIMPKIRYEYSPRLAPALRFDSTGQADSRFGFVHKQKGSVLCNRSVSNDPEQREFQLLQTVRSAHWKIYRSSVTDFGRLVCTSEVDPLSKPLEPRLRTGFFFAGREGDRRNWGWVGGYSMLEVYSQICPVG